MLKFTDAVKNEKQTDIPFSKRLPVLPLMLRLFITLEEVKRCFIIIKLSFFPILNHYLVHFLSQ